MDKQTIELRQMEAMGMLLGKYPLLTISDIADAAEGKCGKDVESGVVNRLNYRLTKLLLIDQLRGKQN